MNPVFRGLIIYIFLLILFRLMGKRTMNETTTFDFLLLLIISEVTQQGLVGEDYSITTAAILITTLIGIDLLLTLIRRQFPFVGHLIEGAPLVILADGKPLKRRMDKVKVEEDDILQSARLNNGIERLEEIKYAVLEKDGSISIIPFHKNKK